MAIVRAYTNAGRRVDIRIFADIGMIAKLGRYGLGLLFQRVHFDRLVWIN